MSNYTLSTETANILASYKPEIPTPSIFDGSEVSPLAAAYSQLIGLWALCIAGTFAGLVVMALAGIVRL